MDVVWEHGAQCTARVGALDKGSEAERDKGAMEEG